jgi:hypothetical protein
MVPNDKKVDIKTPYTPEEFKEIIKNSKVSHLSFDERVAWTEELIEMNQNKWSWEALSINNSLPWSENLIDKYLYKWDFGTVTETPDGRKSYTVGLSDNSGLPWSFELIRKYESKWDWLSLSHSKSIPWSLQILEVFENNWDWDALMENEILWKQVFYPYLDEEIIGAILIILNKKKENILI